MRDSAGAVNGFCRAFCEKSKEGKDLSKTAKKGRKIHKFLWKNICKTACFAVK